MGTSFDSSVRVDGQWKQIDGLSMKVDDVWKACTRAWMKVEGVWKSMAESSIPKPEPITYTITAGANVSSISVNGVSTSITSMLKIVVASEGDTIVVTSAIFDASNNSMEFSYLPLTASISAKIKNGEGTSTTTTATFTMPAKKLAVSFAKTSGAVI